MELRVLWLGAELGKEAFWFGLALTYLAQSLIGAIIIALLVRAQNLSASTRHSCWKMALLGPLLTTLCSFFVEGLLSPLRSAAYGRDVPLPSSVLSRASEALASVGSLGVGAGRPRSELILYVALGAIALGLLRFACAALVLRYRLRYRVPVNDPFLQERFDRLCARMGLPAVALSECAEVRSPLVLGRREVCLPRRLSASLSASECDAVLAHELAHVERADGIWFFIAGATQASLWLNPLNHVLAAHFRSSAELACDDRAVEVTRDALGLARAIVQVAKTASLAQRFADTPTMARSRAGIVARVTRLTCGAAGEPGYDRNRGRLRATVLLALLAGVLGTVRVQLAHATPNSAATTRVPQSSRVARTACSSAAALSEQGIQLAELAARERSILAKLAVARLQATGVDEGAEVSVRELELDQELRHVREYQAWLEASFVSKADGCGDKTSFTQASR